eukprot:GAHX01002179.1.p1 GENE.GAHX01002179.1~~GAHX01002179.1.p1  ORF type:complete len:731 (-),score=159.47 GAHX01002179.1:25-2217(-)
MLTTENNADQALLSTLKTLNSILISIDPHFTLLIIGDNPTDLTKVTISYLSDFPDWIGEQKHFPLNLASLITKLADILILNTKLEILMVPHESNATSEIDSTEKEIKIYINRVFPILVEFLTIPSADVFAALVKQMELFTSFLAQKSAMQSTNSNLSQFNDISQNENSRNSGVTDTNQNKNIHAHPTTQFREFKFYNSITSNLVQLLQDQIFVCFDKETMPYLIKLIFPILKNFDPVSRITLLESISSYIFTNDHLITKYETMYNFETIITSITLPEFNLYMSDFFFSLCSEKNWRIRNITISPTVLLVKSISISPIEATLSEPTQKRCIELFKTHLKDSVLTMNTNSGRHFPEFLTYIPASLLDVELSKLLSELIDKGNTDCKHNCYEFFPTILSGYLSGPLKLKSSPDLILENLRKFLLFNVSLLNNKLKAEFVTNCLPKCLEVLNKYTKQNPTSQHYDYLKLTVKEVTEFYLVQLKKPEVFEYHGFQGFEKVYPFINSANRSMIFELMFKMAQKTIFRAIFKIIETLEHIINNNTEFVNDKENIIIVDIIKQLIMNPIFLIKKKINFSMADYLIKNKQKFNNKLKEENIFEMFKMFKVDIGNIVLFLYKISEDSFGRRIINRYFLKGLINVHILDEKLTVVKIVRNLIVNRKMDLEIYKENKEEEKEWKENVDIVLVQIFYMKRQIQVVSDEFYEMVKEIENCSNNKTVVMGKVIRGALKNVKNINI